MRFGLSIGGIPITIIDTDSAPIDPEASTEEERLDVAEEYIHECSALYRHYPIEEVQRHVEQGTGVQLSDEEAIQIVQGLRQEHGMGPIREYNLPGYVWPEEEDESDKEEEPTAASTSREDARPWWKFW